jgi:hypothetical protein
LTVLWEKLSTDVLSKAYVQWSQTRSRHEISVGCHPRWVFCLHIWSCQWQQTWFAHAEWIFIASKTSRLDAWLKIPWTRRWWGWTQQWTCLFVVCRSCLSAVGICFRGISTFRSRIPRSFVKFPHVECSRVRWVGIFPHQQILGISRLRSFKVQLQRTISTISLQRFCAIYKRVTMEIRRWAFLNAPVTAWQSMNT